ncbi:MAG: leucyl/phenylalanyl-tRNA--protein transferase [Ferruginibacter sp.]
MFILSNDINFPPVENAEEDGFLAIGGDLSPSRLLEGYRNGIFPWYNDNDPICWWSPDPRCVLFPDQLHISKSMKKVINSNEFTFSYNKAFEKVMSECSTIIRKGQNGTWIHPEMIIAYKKLFELGHGFSAEAWHEDQLAGGLYGVRIGKICFGESMFSKRTNASKFAFIKLARQLQEQGVTMIDCQMQTSHLESLGAVLIPRKKFIEILNRNIQLI